jgi:protocatechuate 4,5-dioxygenase alpha subunit
MSRGPGSVDVSLNPPSTFVFTGEICSRSYALNRFAFAFKHAAHRERFTADPEALMREFGLSEHERDLVRRRDWTGLVAHGGHHFNIIKIAAAVGASHFHVGAHMCGADWDEFKHTLPHRVEIMPDDIGEPGDKS